jgi:hypothetical protein
VTDRAIVATSASIADRADAVAYFYSKIAGVRNVRVGEAEVAIRIPRDGIHVFTESPGEAPLSASERVERTVRGGGTELRRFSLDRARLMDQIFIAIGRFTVSVGGTGVKGGENRLIHGPRLLDGRYLRVVLRPEGKLRYVVVSTYPVNEDVWRRSFLDRKARFPA